MLRIGIDTGGTFTDFVALEEESGRTWTAKVSSTPAEPGEAVGEGLRRLAAVLPRPAQRLVIGCTVATNAIIERSGPRVLFLTNDGFTDVPFIGRMDKERLYDLHWSKPAPLVARRDCVGIGGRIDADGQEREPLDLGAVAEFAGDFGDELEGGDCAAAVSLLFSYLNPEHEQHLVESLEAALPGLPISVSHQVSPLWREYERASTTIADAFVKPVVDEYVESVGAVAAAGTGVERWNLLASNGGYLDAREARRGPIQLALSGLAGGVIGGAFNARVAGQPSVFTLDMGGTSCDIGLVIDGEQQYATEFDLDFGMPVTLPCVAVHTIGAGGGSIGWVDPGGLLRVGPRSAGADPGPAAYGLGGTEPTVTDANLVLGRLDAEYFLGGEMTVDPSAARAAVATVGERIGLSPEAAAQAIVRTADENMANAVRLVAVERGLDPRDFALAAFGGAGPLQARAVAERLEMEVVLVPPRPGLCSALGAAIAQARVDRVRTVSVISTDPDLERLAAIEEELREDATAALRRSVDATEPILARSAAMRYAGQNFELQVELPPGPVGAAFWAELLDRFEAAHEEKYGFRLPGEPIELIDLRIAAALAEAEPALRAEPPADTEPGRRSVLFDDAEPVECPVLARAALAEGEVLRGPAVIQETDSTTLAWAGDLVTVLPGGSLEIRIGGGS